MRWEFITKPIRGSNSVAWEWEWRRTDDDGTEAASARTFSSFRDCTADARRHGFTGDPEPGESGTLFGRPEARFNWY